jgi:hypothetical protein
MKAEAAASRKPAKVLEYPSYLFRRGGQTYTVKGITFKLHVFTCIDPKTPENKMTLWDRCHGWMIFIMMIISMIIIMMMIMFMIVISGRRATSKGWKCCAWSSASGPTRTSRPPTMNTYRVSVPHLSRAYTTLGRLECVAGSMCPRAYIERQIMVGTLRRK